MAKTAEQIFENLTKKENFEYHFLPNIKKLGSRLVMITAPPGAGKTSCINGVLLMNYFVNKIFAEFNLPEPKFIYIPGTTTRPLREDERHDFDFHFLSPIQFFDQLKRKEFLLYFISSPYLYAVDGKDIERRLSLSDAYTVFIYNLNAFQVPRLQNKFSKRPKVIFLNAPTIKELEKRKFKRGGLSSAEIEFRKRTMLAEIVQGQKISDIQIINKNFPETIFEILDYILKSIIKPNAKLKNSIIEKLRNEIRKEIRKNSDKLLTLVK
jgi:guanylate kinase